MVYNFQGGFSTVPPKFQWQNENTLQPTRAIFQEIQSKKAPCWLSKFVFTLELKMGMNILKKHPVDQSLPTGSELCCLCS